MGLDRIAAVAQTVKARTGGRLVAESLEALGAEVAFGVPGIHALAIWDGLRTSSISGDRPPHRALGRLRRGRLRAHERTAGAPPPLHGPRRADLAGRADGSGERARPGRGDREPDPARPDRRRARVPARAPRPEGLLRAGGEVGRPRRERRGDPGAARRGLAPGADAAERAGVPGDPGRRARGRDRRSRRRAGHDSARASASGRRRARRGGRGCSQAPRAPVVWAGGGVLRSGAWDELRLVAERLGAPVATTYMGKGAFPEDDPLAARDGAWTSRRSRSSLGGADVLLAVGTELGAETTGQYGLRLSGRLIHVDADPRRIGATYEALGLVGDAKAVLAALAERLPGPPREDGPARVAALRQQDRRAAPEPELGLLRTHPRSASPRRRDRVGHDHPGLLGGGALPGLRAAHLPLPARLGNARLRVAGGARRLARRSRPPGAGGRRRRRLQLRHRRARRRAPARARREAPARRRRRLRDPARVPARPVRGDDQRRPRRARLPRARRGLRRPGRLGGARRPRRGARSRASRRTGPAVVHLRALLEMWS